jgi:type VI secretion system protein ImpL
VLWTWSYRGNREFVEIAQAGTAAAKDELARLGPPRVGDDAQLVRSLNALRTLPGGYRDQRSGESPAPGLGLSQAGKIGAQALRAYRNALRDALFPRLALLLESEIQDAARTTRQVELEEALRAYLSLYEGTKADPKAVEAAARRLWRLPDVESAALLAHLRAGLEDGAPEMRHPRDEAIIREARQKLAAAKKT